MHRIQIVLSLFLAATPFASLGFSQNSLSQVCLDGSDPLLCTTIPAQFQDYVANDFIRMENQAGALEQRNEIVDYIWSGQTLPATMPTVSAFSFSNADSSEFSSRFGTIDPTNVQSIEQLETTVDGLENTGFFLHPPNASPNVTQRRLAILHQGHDEWASGNLDVLANDLLSDGWSVMALTMPLFGWNLDRTATVPSGEVTWASGTTGHRQMFPLPDPTIDGNNSFRFFLEPTIAGINYATSQAEAWDSVTMVGFSGGGWTTTLAAAIDPRIDTSFAVAGSLPLSLQAEEDHGDDEQIWPSLYDIENGGIASYEELYVLGAFGEDRKATQITNQFDPCCFYGVLGELYDGSVEQKIADLGAGEWQYLLDSTHSEHAISAWTQQAILAQIQSVPEPSSHFLMLGVLFTALFLRANRNSGDRKTG